MVKHVSIKDEIDQINEKILLKSVEEQDMNVLSERRS